MTNLLGFYFLSLLWVLKLLSLLFITFWFILISFFFFFFFCETSFLSISKKAYRGYWLWKQRTDP